MGSIFKVQAVKEVFLQCLALGDGTDRLSWNVGTNF